MVADCGGIKEDEGKNKRKKCRFRAETATAARM